MKFYSKAMLFVAIAAICFSTNANNKTSQTTNSEFDVTLSEPYRVVDARYKSYMKAGDYIVSFKYDDEDELIIQSFDKETMNEVARVEHKSFDKRVLFKNRVYANNKLEMFYSLWDKDAELEQLFVVEIDPKTAKLVGKPKRVIAVNDKVEGKMSGTQMFRLEMTNKFNIEFNSDLSAYMVSYLQKDEETERRTKENERKLSVHVFDLDHNEIWANEHINLGNMNEIAYLDYDLGNNKNVYVLTKNYKNGKRKDRISRSARKANYDLRFFEITTNGDINESQKIDIEDRFINYVSIFNQDEKVMIGGNYGTYKTSGTEGIFAIEFDKDGNITRDIHKEFPLEYIQMYMDEKTKKKAKKKEDKGKLSLPHLELHHMILKGDGSLIAIGQSRWQVTSTSTDANGNTSTRTTYYAGNIYVTKISADDQPNWMNVIPARQRNHHRGYKLLTKDDVLHFVYHDNAKNLKLRTNENPHMSYAREKSGGGRISSATLDLSTGEVSKENLFIINKVNDMKIYQFSLNRIVRLNENEIAAEVYKKKKEDVWILVKLKN